MVITWMKAKSHSKKSTSSLSTIMLRVDDLRLAPSKAAFAGIGVCMYLRELKWMLGSESDKKEK